MGSDEPSWLELLYLLYQVLTFLRQFFPLLLAISMILVLVLLLSVIAYWGEAKKEGQDPKRAPSVRVTALLLAVSMAVTAFIYLGHRNTCERLAKELTAAQGTSILRAGAKIQQLRNAKC